MKVVQPADFPANEETILQPTTVLYTHKSNGSKNISVIDITDHDSNAQSTIDLDVAKAKANGRKPMLELSQDTWYSRTLKATDDSGAVVAEVSGPLLALGLWTLTFPTESPHSSHPIELRPAGMLRREDVFVKDSIPYIWDVLDAFALCKLYKVMDSKRVEVARYTAKHSRDSTGVLVVDGKEVDLVVAVMTWLAVLKRSDSFRK
ncbi:hypothetical protein N431DRAFT_513597 [Stipitochalara longipes BDJ]|nr:hypothetical protein N431DRAFT_513597 [Stipitochalara longipes BDJ]